jgi:integrase
MMATRKRRTEWHRVKGRWMCTLVCTVGGRSVRVRLFEMTKGGKYYRDVWVPGRGKDRKCLHTTDRAEAERVGSALLTNLFRKEEITAEEVLTLGTLWERFKTECPQYLDNTERTRTDEARHVSVVLAFLGEDCDVRYLTEHDVRSYEAKRLKGGIVLPDGEKARAVRARTVAVEVRLLKTMLRWATTCRVRRGRRLLATNPLAGVKTVREANPKRPIASWERFTKTLAAVRKLRSVETISDAERIRWLRLELALVLVEATGRRIGSIRQLRWSDLDLGAKLVEFRAEADKKRRQWEVPMPDGLVAEVRSLRAQIGGAFGNALLFPSITDPNVPMRREMLDDWLIAAEKAAGLCRLDGGLWHPYRRKWATERKDLPVGDVAAAGGWRDVGTMITCYQQPDRDTLLRVMTETKKVTEAAVSG